MARTIDWSRQARSDIKKLPKLDADRVRRAVQQIAIAGQGSIVQLKGFAVPHYRLRVGDWRVRYRIEDDKIQIVRVLHRREAYRKSGLVRQDVPGADGFEEIADWESPEGGSDRPRASRIHGAGSVPGFHRHTKPPSPLGSLARMEMLQQPLPFATARGVWNPAHVL